MKIQIVAACGFISLSSLAVGTDQRPPQEDCIARLEKLVPAKTNAAGMAVRATWNSTAETYAPTAEMYQKQLAAEYWASAEYQARHKSPEEYIEAVLPLIMKEEESIRSAPTRHWKTEAIVTESNIFARHYDSSSIATPTQEVVMLKMEKSGWQSHVFNHIDKTVLARMEKNANEFFSLFLSLTPQESHRSSWQWYSIILQKTNSGANLAKLLCEFGEVRLDKLLLRYTNIDNQRHLFGTEMPVPNGMLHTESELEQGPCHIRLLRYELRGPELTTKVLYEYRNPESPWPSAIHQIDRNIQSDQTLLDRTVEIKEVAPADKWDFNAILNALLKKYSDYSYVEMTSLPRSSQPPTAPNATVPGGTNAMASSEKADRFSPPAADVQEPRPKSLEKITCPRCQGDESLKPDCTLCGGRGTIWVESPKQPAVEK